MSKESPSREPSMRRGVVLLSILALACAALGSAQQTQSNSIPFLVAVNEGQTDVSSKGVNLNNCALILPDGRFHLERRVQQLPNSSAKLEIFESSLDSAQFRQLQGIINDADIKKLPSFVRPTVPMMGTRFRGFKARIVRGDQIQTVGYYVWQDGTPEKSPESAPNDMNNDIRKNWKESEAALRPLLQWFQGLEAAKLEPSVGKSTLCSTDGYQ